MAYLKDCLLCSLSPSRIYCFSRHLFVCLFVCQQLYAKKLSLDFDEIFWKSRGWYKEESIRFWKLSVKCRPLPMFKGKITLVIFNNYRSNFHENFTRDA